MCPNAFSHIYKAAKVNSCEHTARAQAAWKEIWSWGRQQINERCRADIVWCLWAWSKVIACSVTFPCKLKLMAPINSHSVALWHQATFLHTAVKTAALNQPQDIDSSGLWERQTAEKPSVVIRWFDAVKAGCSRTNVGLHNLVRVPPIPHDAERRMDSAEDTERLRREVSSFRASRTSVQPWQGLCNLMQLLPKRRLSSAFETPGAQRREWQFGAVFNARLSTDSHSGSVRCVYVQMLKLFLVGDFCVG